MYNLNASLGRELLSRLLIAVGVSEGGVVGLVRELMHSPHKVDRIFLTQ